jgi:replicative DNA helicase
MSPGSVWAIAGGTSSGKSTLLSQILVEGLLQRAVVAVFSLEMPIAWQLARLTGAYLRKSPTRVFMGDLDESEQLQCQGTLELFGETPLYIFREIAELSEICAAARRIRAEHGRLDLVAVDFIQNVAVRGAGAQMERMAAASTELQRLSGEINCCMLIASQLSNEAVREKGGGILTFRYASELGHAADVAMELVSKTNGTVDLLVRKNRSGRLGKIPLRWGNEYSRFEVET